jgi:hypothetical protein
MSQTLFMFVAIIVGLLLFRVVVNYQLRNKQLAAFVKRMQPRTNPLVIIGASCAFWIIVGLILWIFFPIK